jgi:HEAT repeat protein
MAPAAVSDRCTLLIVGLLAFSIPVGAQPGRTKTADQLSRDLSDGSAEVRRRAAADLSELGHEAIPAVPALSAALKDNAAAVRSAAALAISRIGPEAAAAVPNLISLLKDQDPITRQRAVSALHSIGPAAKPAVEALKEALKDNALDNSSRAANALGRIGEPAIPALIEAMSHTNVETRRRAVLGLISLGLTARKAIPALAAALQDTDDWVRRYACWALGRTGADAKEALPALRQRLKDKNLHFQFDAAEAMLLIDPSAAGPVEVLKSKDMLREMPLYAASALALVPTEAETALPILIKTLEEEPVWRRDMAIKGIGRLGPKNGAPAVPKLQAIARNGQPTNRLAAAETLATLAGKPNELLTVIDLELASQSSEQRAAGLKALAKLGPQGKESAERVIPLLKDDDWAVREAARSAMSRIDPSRAMALKIPD